MPRTDWFRLGVPKGLSHAQSLVSLVSLVSFWGYIQNFRRASMSVPYGSPPRASTVATTVRPCEVTRDVYDAGSINRRKSDLSLAGFTRD